MKRAIGLLEIKNVARGIFIADAMLKAGNVELISALSLCPGKYIIMVAGDVGAVQSAVNSGRNAGQEFVVDDFILPNVHPSLFPALAGCTEIKSLGALGIIETFSAASAVAAADTAAKAAPVELVEIRLARGLGGKAVITLTGDVGAVTAAVQAGSTAIEESGFLVDRVVLAAPHKDLHEAIL
ncbi:BMC domain-containing protein [Sporolituus thermophilus]|uniref:Carboxysome shell and ethanolamine utilization microcompartment protein CcmL/EutN n=1 Tax=Sporolituus thermophilus DSM 23256 TaxID=1123285 RepID=A0A1G7M613_9FIRM|nr:BMC domain-containing protein [Sporolituus thermophilus]SDF56619.1 Carboxysome shell and ethanolamine utilization microcompartment protein CcmL/EutN [Sporolituus thermophilus DSM 23256]